MKEGKSKVVKCEYKSEYASSHGTLYNFHVEFEDGMSGLYNAKSKDNPKFRVGEEAPYTAEEREGKSGNFFIIKYKQEQKFGGGGYKARPSYSRSLEWARKMYNSSFQTEKPWEFSTLTQVAGVLLKKINEGIDADAIETAVTIECAKAVHGESIDSKRLMEHISIVQDWINKNK